VAEEPINIVNTNTQFFNKYLRKIDSQTVSPTGVDFWKAQLGDSSLKIPFAACYGGLKQNSMADIDFLLIHNALYTNERLFKCKLITSPSCTFCKSHTESIFHLFIECHNVNDLLVLIWDLCQSITAKEMSFEYICHCILFGYPSRRSVSHYKLINFILHIYRFTVWCCRKWYKAGRKLCLMRLFKIFIEKRLKLEYKAAEQSGSVNNFFDVFGVGEALVIPAHSNFLIPF
jgi:hypothetical protein